jgi:hypothetical protein
MAILTPFVQSFSVCPDRSDLSLAKTDPGARKTDRPHLPMIRRVRMSSVNRECPIETE